MEYIGQIVAGPKFFLLVLEFGRPGRGGEVFCYSARTLILSVGGLRGGSSDIEHVFFILFRGVVVLLSSCRYGVDAF